MRTTPHRLARLGLLLALLPGLLLAQGQSLRFCLHTWSDALDCCASATEREATDGCCASAPERDTLADQIPCDDCCIHLGGLPNELFEPAPPPVLPACVSALLAPRFTITPHLTPPLRARVLAKTPATAAPPGRAPTPLRI